MVIGGFAAQLWGSPYDTVDLDVTPERSRQNLKRLVDALKELKAKVRLEPGSEQQTLVLTPEFIDRFQNLALSTVHGDLDLCLVPDGTHGYRDLRRAASRERLTDTLEVDVASLADVIRSKQAAAREKDLIQLRTLRRLLARQEEVSDGT